MRGFKKLGAALVAAALLVATDARAATPTKGESATDIGFAWATTNAGAKLHAIAGCDGPAPQVARIQVIALQSGAVVWDAPPPSRPACFYNVMSAGDDVYVSGSIDDDDADGGRNLLVRKYRARDGALLWEQEFEAPNPKQDYTNTLHNSANLQIAGQRLMVWVGSTGGANPSMVLRLDRATGALLPPAP